METMGQGQQSSEDILRNALATALNVLRTSEAANAEQARAQKIAITQLEIASMCAIRSLFADKGEYSPMVKLQPKAE